MTYKHYPDHNVQVTFDETEKNAQTFIPILQWLQTTSLTHAVTTPVVINENQIRDFWNSAEFATDANGVGFIAANVSNEDIIIYEQTVREVLQLNDNVDQSINFTMDRLRHIFISDLLYQAQQGDIQEFHKVRMPFEYRFIVHIVMGCLSPRRGGQSKVSREYANMMVAILYRLPYNFSRMIFRGMRGNIDAKDKFLMYPRFLQMIISHLLPDTPTQGNTLVQTRPNVFGTTKKVTKNSVYVVPLN